MMAALDVEPDDLWAVEMMIEVWESVRTGPISPEVLAASMLEAAQLHTGITPTGWTGFMAAASKGAMPTEGHTSHGLHNADALKVFSPWRAEVGRLPRAHEHKVSELTRRFGFARMQRSVISVRDSRLRRTHQRWNLFLSLFGEAP